MLQKTAGIIELRPLFFVRDALPANGNGLCHFTAFSPRLVYAALLSACAARGRLAPKLAPKRHQSGPQVQNAPSKTYMARVMAVLLKLMSSIGETDKQI